MGTPNIAAMLSLSRHPLLKNTLLLDLLIVKPVKGCSFFSESFRPEAKFLSPLQNKKDM